MEITQHNVNSTPKYTGKNPRFQNLCVGCISTY